jgi:hypothetical protein
VRFPAARTREAGESSALARIDRLGLRDRVGLAGVAQLVGRICRDIAAADG